MIAVQFKKRENHPANLLFLKSTLSLLIMTLAFVPFGVVAKAQEAPTKQQALTKPKENAKTPIPIVKKQRKTSTQIQQKLKALDNLYVPIHWVNPANGLAIAGFDPVAYFEKSKAMPGMEEFEHAWHSVSWRFINDGNRRAFIRSPSVYAPVFAGYDAYALSNGILSLGLPTIWTILNSRLYLFHNAVNRYLWLENHKAIHKKTEQNWSELSLDVPRFKIIKSQ